MKDFTDKVAVVTGAASGIGRGMAETFIAAGMKVVLSDIETQALDETTRALLDAGADVHPVVTDVSKPDQVEHLATETLRKYGAGAWCAGLLGLCREQGRRASDDPRAGLGARHPRHPRQRRRARRDAHANLVADRVDAGSAHGSREPVVAGHSARSLRRPEDIASMAAYLASEEAAYITGAELVVDGGLTSSPAGAPIYRW
jgi:NAD(P)-dependent dehydrogenase (short-subunit alcohol dehydrogenase family)